jgi:glyoxylase-like metal-dependent hydrolase (beta-lactamase superfamily II)
MQALVGEIHDLAPRPGSGPDQRKGSVEPKEQDVEKIGDRVYHLPDIIGGPTILLGETVVLVDTGVPGSDDAILAAVEEIGRNATDVTDIVITHADGDHVGSLSALVARTGATVWAGEHEADVIEGKAPARGGDTTQTAAVDRRFLPGETLPLQGGIETVDTHGHTVGHISLFLPGERILIAGDAINNVEGLAGSREQFTANAEDARAAVSTLAALGPNSIIFGHGPSIVGSAADQLEELDRSLP